MQQSLPRPDRLVVPALSMLAAALLLGGGDLWLADRLYALQGGHWQLQTHWLTGDLLHTGGRRLSILLTLLVLVAWVVACQQPRWQAWRRPLGCLLLSVLLSTALVAMLKSVSPLDCPWDLYRYGGSADDGGHWPGNPLSPGKCFPAGHASAGYAWMALYFFLSAVRPGWRYAGLLAGITAGVGFGVAQQLRGAHFLSHDVVTALLCWLVAVGTARVMRPQPDACA